MTQRNKRIDAYRPPRRNVTSQQRDADEQYRRTRKRQRVRRPHAIQQSRHQVRHDQRMALTGFFVPIDFTNC